MWCWRRLLRLPWTARSKEIKIKGNHPWIFNGITGAVAEAPILWAPDVKSWLTGKDPHVGKDLGQEEKGATEDEIIGWHHQLNEHELSKLWKIVKDREACQAAVHGVPKNRTQLSNWTIPVNGDLNNTLLYLSCWLRAIDFKIISPGWMFHSFIKFYLIHLFIHLSPGTVLGARDKTKNKHIYCSPGIHILMVIEISKKKVNKYIEY